MFIIVTDGKSHVVAPLMISERPMHYSEVSVGAAFVFTKTAKIFAAAKLLFAQNKTATRNPFSCHSQPMEDNWEY